MIETRLDEFDYKTPLSNTRHIKQMNEETLVFKGLDWQERKKIHILCDKIGLHHESKPNPKRKKRNRDNKHLYIYKPKLWLWEYTEENPYSKSKGERERQETERQIKKQKVQEKLSKKYCCICGKNGWETELLCSVYISGLYCDDCLDTESDGEGGKLCDHKFEPL